MDRFQPSLSLAALLLGVELIGGCTHGPLDEGSGFETIAFDRAVSYAPTPCWFEAPSGRQVSCGQLAVPEDWTAEHSATIHLPVVVFEAASRPRRDPVIFLNGGPGARSPIETDEEIAGWIWFLRHEYWTRDRDFIVLAQRGTNWSDSNLWCPPVSYADFFAVAADARSRQADWRLNVDRATRACWERLVAEGHNVAAYNSSQSAMDVAALRVAMRIPTWSVYGVSYGTRFALTLMRDHPDGIESVILDSVYPPLATDLDGDTTSFHNVLLAFFASCASDALCSTHYPDLERSFASVVERLRDDPLELTLTNRDKPRSIQVTLSPILFLQLVRNFLSDNRSIEHLPDFVDGFQDSKSGPTHLEYLADGASERLVHGAYLATLCNDHPGPSRPRQSDDDAGPALLRDWIVAGLDSRMCQAWPASRVQPNNHAAVVSDIPVLILAGALDPITPVAYAHLTAATLSRAHVFVFPGMSHGVVGGDACATKIVAAFLVAPETRPHVACPDPARRPDFSPSVNARAVLLLKDGERLAAEQLLQQVYQAQTSTLAPDHPNIALTATNLGLLYMAQGRLEDAEHVLKRALAIDFNAAGPQSAETALSSLLLALSYHLQGRDSEAETLFRRARRIARDLPPAGRSELTLALQDYVDLLRTLRQFAAANELERRMVHASEGKRI
jgi:pimeloyl-ACP methyl ester carboxylesterase